MGVDRKTNTAGGGALQRGHRASLESLAQLGDALCSVGAQSKTVEAAELVVGQAAKLERSRVSTGADRNANTRGGGALKRSHSAPLEPLAQLGDAVSGVLAVTIIVDTTEVVLRQAAKGGQGQCQWALHGSNYSVGGALQLLEHAVFLDAARDDDGGGDAQPLVREVNLFGQVRALELVNLKCMTVDTAKGRGML